MPTTRENDPAPDSDSNRRNGKRRPYTSPRVLSAERLEAAAATCATPPPANPFGKTTGPFLCDTLGS